jgi:hypothetical protein
VHIAQGVGTAQCVVHYAGVGNHSITAFYLGNAGFGGSGSAPQAVSVKRLPPKIKGTVTSTLTWRFAYAPTSTRALLILLHKPELGTIITFACRGPLCPFSHHSQTVKKVHGRVPATINIGPPTSDKLHPRDVMTILLKRMGWIGKGYVFTIRAGKAPLDHIGCLAPGSTKIGVGCTTPVSTKKKKG